MRRLALLLLATSCAWAQLPNLRPETTLLAEVREKMLSLLGNQPNYTCLETVERTRQAPGGRSRIDDTLRLEVALADGKEMFAWPGAKQFEDRDIRDLVSTGMFGNGNYGLYVRMLFQSNGPNFEYRGEVPLLGLQLARYDFRVHVSRSGYHLRSDDHEAVTGFHGSIYLDPVKAELRRLEVIADDIPPELGLTSAEDRVDYASLLIGDEMFLLPVESSLQMASKDSVSRNRVQFSACRKFAGESSLIFEDPDLVDVTVVKPVREVELPVDVLITVEITSELRLDRAAVGDAVTGVLRSDVKRGKETVVKKGAVVKGRILVLDRSGGTYTLGLMLQELEWVDGHASVHAKFEGFPVIGIAGRPRLLMTPEGMLQVPSGSRSMRGETLYFRTVR
ncbi:MAG: hypothetical protein ABIR70_24555 [Bryobacteraceae bacterium]